MTRRLAKFDPARRGAPIRLLLEGKPVRAYAGETVAAALFASGHRVLSRSLKYHRPRAFFCLEGHCGACLMRIDGVPNLRACMEPCRDGLEVAAQNAYPSADLDVLEAVDWLFPSGMDHHRMMTGSRLLNAVVNRVVRQLSGLGQLPDRPARDIPPARDQRVDVVVIGGGPAGLAAATSAAGRGATTLLIDEHVRPGGSLLADPRHGPAAAAERAQAARQAGVEILAPASAIAYFAEDEPAMLAVATPAGLVRVHARRHVYATGGYSVNALFGNNDRPGILGARAIGRLLVDHQVKPADRIGLVGVGDYPDALAGALGRAGCEVIVIDDTRERVSRARGRTWVTGVVVEDMVSLETRRVDCDLVGVWAPPAPASEAARQHGCRVELRPALGGFAVLCDEQGRTSVPGVFACGDVCGYRGPDEASRRGQRAGVAAAESLAGAASAGSGAP